MKKQCAKIIVKNNYEKRGDLVLRSYIRALQKAKIGKFLDGENAVIYGFIDDNGLFHELYTGEVIDYDGYVEIIAEEMYRAFGLSDVEKELIKKLNEKILFGKDVKIDLEISTSEDLAKDRSIEFDAYNNCLSRINPYMRLSENEQERYNAYNSFETKLKEIKKMRKTKHEVNYDEYDVKSYYPMPEREKEEEYLVFEVPKIKVKRK